MGPKSPVTPSKSKKKIDHEKSRPRSQSTESLGPRPPQATTPT